MAGMFFTLAEEVQRLGAKIKVVGVGGGGCNAINSMIERELKDVEYIAINTDAQVLETSPAGKTIIIGSKLTQGLGAGSNPDIGKQAALESEEEIKAALDGAHMIFITGGMGGGTGTGAAPVVAEIAKSLGSLVVGIVTKPFSWEGPTKLRNAENGIEELKKNVDSIIVVQNDKILTDFDSDLEAIKMFDKPNEILYEATRSVADIITIKGLINVDLADVKTIMSNSGMAMMGTGTASGQHRAIEAAERAIQSPLLDGINIQGARKLLVNITGNKDLRMSEVNQAMKLITNKTHPEAHTIFGCVFREEMGDYMSITVIATGLDENAAFEIDEPENVITLETKSVTPLIEPKTAPRKESIIPPGTADYDDITDNDDSEIIDIDFSTPAYERANLAKTQPQMKKSPISFGFNFAQDENLDAMRDEAKNKVRRDTGSNSDETSDFLRAVLD